MAYTQKDAEKAGWSISLEQEPEAIQTTGTGAQHEITVREGKFIAEKTYSDHLITAVGSTKEKLLEAIESQQASLDSPAAPSPEVPLVNVDAGDAGKGKENVGLAGVLPETAVKSEPESLKLEPVNP